MKKPNTVRRRSVWIIAALILIAAALIIWPSHLFSPSTKLVLANTSYHLIATQTVVSVVFTNTIRRPLVAARNSVVDYLTTDGWQKRYFNNVSQPDLLITRPGQVVSYQLYLPQGTIRFRVTTHFSRIGWAWLALSALPNKWIPDPIGKLLAARFVKSTQFFPLSTPEIVVEGGRSTAPPVRMAR